jgi:glucose-1-phosphate thymidylyltransferase
MKAVILCAGYATRLYFFTINEPKALLMVDGRPLLSFTTKNLSEIKQIDRTYVVTNDKFYQKFIDWKEQEGSDIEVINDGTSKNEERLGGVMDFALALEKIDDDILIVFGDLFFDFPLKRFADYFHKTGKACVALHDLKDKEKAKRFGVLEMQGERIIGFQEKPENPRSSLINAGAFIFPKQTIPQLKEYIKSEKNKENIGYIIIDWIKDKDIRGFVFEEEWHDIGTIEDYERIKKEIKEKQLILKI